MSEQQQYRVHACNNTELHEPHEFRGTYRKPSLPGVEITETFQCEGIERPRSTTDMTAMSHETAGFCFCGQMHGRIDSWNEHDWAALREYMPAVHSGVRIERPVPPTDEPKRQPGFWATHVEDPVTGVITNEDGSPYLAAAPHPPTREQIAEAVHEVVENGSWSNADEMEPLITDAVLALIQNGADR